MAEKTENSCDDKQVSEIRQMPNLWLRKLATILFVWDLDNDGYAGNDDMMNIADKIIQVGNFNGKSGDNIINFYRDIIKHTSDNPSSEVVKATSLSEQLVAAWRVKDNPDTVKLWCKVYSDMFKVIDFNATGFLTFDQYLVFWNTFNLDRRFAKMQFD
ncbi:unnamed protein product, partial [Owenia fusiformis]